MHNGRLNQYIIWVNGKKHELLPLVEKHNENHYTIVRVCLVEGNQFIKHLKEKNVCFALIPRRVENQDELEHAPEIESLLTKFQDIMSNNVPDGLPCIRSISHCMDLIHGASFPNKALHRLTPN